MSAFARISELGWEFGGLSSYFVNFYYHLSQPLINTVGMPDEIAMYIPQWSVLQFCLGLGLSFFLSAHLIKLVRQAFLF